MTIECRAYSTAIWRRAYSVMHNIMRVDHSGVGFLASIPCEIENIITTFGVNRQKIN